MLKTKVGYSINENAFKAGEEAALRARGVGALKLGMLYTNSSMDQKKVLEGAKSVLGNIPIIGSTSSNGLIVKDGVISGNNYVGLMGFSDEQMIVGVAGSEKTNEPREIGKQIAREAIVNAGIKKVPSYFYFVSSPEHEEEYLRGIEDVIGNVPFFGGSAADDTYEANWSIFCNDKIIKEGCAVAFFYAKNECIASLEHPYEETDEVGVVTKIDENRNVLEIDKIYAAEKYYNWTNINLEEVLNKGLTFKTILNPFGVKSIDGKITAIRYPMMFNEDGSIFVSNPLTEKTALIKMTTTKEKMINSVYTSLSNIAQKSKREIETYLMFYSGFNKYYLKEEANNMYNAIKKATKDKEFLMVFTFSEVGNKNNSSNVCASLSCSYAGITK